MLNTRKWMQVKIKGCVSGFTGKTEAVMGGKIACGEKGEVMRQFPSFRRRRYSLG